jgi:hypothetical protein
MTIRYQLIKGIAGMESKQVRLIDDSQPNKQTIIPFAEDNTDYQAYLKWVAEGNTPEPADE